MSAEYKVSDLNHSVKKRPEIVLSGGLADE
jgi:hypothetical protein